MKLHQVNVQFTLACSIHSLRQSNINQSLKRQMTWGLSGKDHFTLREKTSRDHAQWWTTVARCCCNSYRYFVFYSL